MHCWLCRALLTSENRSQEHIIPKALGGKRTVKDFLCRRCNNTTGTKWDAALVEAFKPLDFMASSRDWAEQPRNFDLRQIKNRHETVSGNETRTIYRGGGDSVTSFDGRELKARFNSPSETQSLQILQSILRKYAVPIEKRNDLTDEVILQFKRERESGHSVETVIAVNFPSVGRSLVKSTLALACAEGVSQEDCGYILPDWREDDNRILIGFPDWEVLPAEKLADVRCVVVSGSRETGILVGFAHLFWLSMMIPLSVPYKGPSIHAVYAFNAKTREEVELSPQMERPRSKEVALETAGHLAELPYSRIRPESRVDMVVDGHLRNESGIREIRNLFAPKLRAFYNLSREAFNQEYRIGLGLPPIGEDGKLYQGIPKSLCPSRLPRQTTRYHPTLAEGSNDNRSSGNQGRRKDGS